jgi:hypothetical protein
LQDVAINVIQFIMTLQKFFRALRAPLFRLLRSPYRSRNAILLLFLEALCNEKIHYHSISYEGSGSPDDALTPFGRRGHRAIGNVEIVIGII